MYQCVLFDLEGTLIDLQENADIKDVTGKEIDVLYPGIRDMLCRLAARQIVLAVASDRPKEQICELLKYIEIDGYFSLVVGNDSDMDVSGKEKITILQEGVKQLKKKTGRRLGKENVMIVGDRRCDLEAAMVLGVTGVEVSYGYAEDGELMRMTPDALVDDVEQLEEVITGEKGYYRYRDKSAFLKTIEILRPFLLYWALELIIYNLLYLTSSQILLQGQNGQQLSVWLNAATAIATWPMLSVLYRRSYIGDTSPVVTRRKSVRFSQDSILVVVYAVAIAVGLNILIAHLRIIAISDTYERVSSTQYSVSLLVGLVIYGILTPFTEELMFRGILYNRIRKYFPVPMAIMLSSLIFACYHGNLVQMLYAGIMGMVMAMLYEYYDRLLAAPVLFHCAANIMVYALSKSNVFAQSNGPVLQGVVLLAVAAGISCWYIKCFAQKASRRGQRKRK